MEQNYATISGRNTAEICAMGRKGSRNIEIKATEPEEWANRWIATFEDETVGDMIVVWDIKVLLSAKPAGPAGPPGRSDDVALLGQRPGVPGRVA